MSAKSCRNTVSGCLLTSFGVRFDIFFYHRSKERNLFFETKSRSECLFRFGVCSNKSTHLYFDTRCFRCITNIIPIFYASVHGSKLLSTVKQKFLFSTKPLTRYLLLKRLKHAKALLTSLVIRLNRFLRKKFKRKKKRSFFRNKIRGDELWKDVPHKKHLLLLTIKDSLVIL